MKTIIGVAILILFTLLHSMFRLLPFNGHSVNNKAADTNFIKKREEKKGFENAHLIWTLGWAVMLALLQGKYSMLVKVNFCKPVELAETNLKIILIDRLRGNWC
jgi:hypothetical protein